MGIRSLSTASISTGTKRSKVWDQSAVVITNSFESIATVNVGAGGASYVEFTSIPQTFTHLQVRAMTNAASASWVVLTLNGDTTTNNYAHHRLGSDGASSILGSNIGNSATNYVFTSYPHTGGSVIDILNYSNSTRNKTVRGLHAHKSDSTTEGEVNFMAHLWMNTNAVTSIKFSLPSTTFNQYTTFALYGIRGA